MKNKERISNVNYCRSEISRMTFDYYFNYDCFMIIVGVYMLLLFFFLYSVIVVLKSNIRGLEWLAYINVLIYIYIWMRRNRIKKTNHSIVYLCVFDYYNWIRNKNKTKNIRTKVSWFYVSFPLCLNVRSTFELW